MRVRDSSGRCPLDFLARLASLVPKPRANLTRYHGIFAPHARHRSLITPASRRARAVLTAETDPDFKTPEQRRQSLTWAQRLKRVFGIDVSTCDQCGAPARIIACIEDPKIIDRILNHLAAARAPPQLPLLPPLSA